MLVDIHSEDNDNYEDERPHIVENSNLVITIALLLILSITLV